MKISLAIFGISGVFALANCGHPKDEPAVFDCSNETVTWTNFAGQILPGTCGIEGCHDQKTHVADHDFSDFQAAKNSILADQKQMLGAIQHTEGYQYMPLNDYPLPESLVKKISCWVQNGMPE